MADRTVDGCTEQGESGDHIEVTILRALVLAVTLVGTLFGTATAATAAPATTAAPSAVLPLPRFPARRRPGPACGSRRTRPGCCAAARSSPGRCRSATGARASSRPPGTFRVSFKNEDHISSVYNQPMPFSVFFNGDIAFHQGSVRQKSHGCVHLSAISGARVLRRADSGRPSSGRGLSAISPIIGAERACAGTRWMPRDAVGRSATRRSPGGYGDDSRAADLPFLV